MILVYAIELLTNQSNKWISAWVLKDWIYYINLRNVWKRKKVYISKYHHLA